MSRGCFNGVLAAGLACLPAMLLGGCASTRGEAGEVHAFLDSWHNAASRADKEAYFGRIASDGIFLGTDDTERWTLTEFRQDYEGYFDSGRGWTFVPHDRKVNIERPGLAWFDELLDSEHLGVCRGSGVVRREGGQWVIVQYNLSVPIPNEMVDTLVPMINQHRAARKPAQP